MFPNNFLIATCKINEVWKSNSTNEEEILGYPRDGSPFECSNTHLFPLEWQSD